jgi:hypothetical protein
MKKLHRVASFTYNTDAAILVAKLEAEGISTFLENEHLVGANPLLSNAVGGVDVMVREGDLEKAMALVKEVEEGNKQAALAGRDLLTGYRKVEIFCPECESFKVYRRKVSFIASFVAVDHVCADCQYRWKQ